MAKQNINYLEVLMDKKIPDEILLYFAIENQERNLKILYDYRLYGQTCEKLFKLCDEDYNLFSYNLSMIERSSFITLDVVHINLNFDEPILFINSIPRHFDEDEVYTRGVEFINKYDRKFDELLNNHQTIFPR